MFTSRAEYRLILREDNADLRLREIGRRIGLVNEEDYERYLEKKQAIEGELERLENTKVYPTADVNDTLTQMGSSPLKKPHTLKELLRRPDIDHKKLGYLDPGTSIDISGKYSSQIEMEVKYEGYIKMQMEQVKKFRKLEEIKIPSTFEYDNIPGLSNEIIQKLNTIKPNSLGQATRVSGVTPAAISVLMVYLRKSEALSSKQFRSG